MLNPVQQNSANHPLPIRLVSSTDHVTAVTGATVTVTVSKDGAASWSAASGTVTEVGNGAYWLNGNSTDRNTQGRCLYKASATGADDFIGEFTVYAYDPWNVLPTGNAGGSGGLAKVGTQIPNANYNTAGGLAVLDVNLCAPANLLRAGNTYQVVVTPGTAGVGYLQVDTQRYAGAATSVDSSNLPNVNASDYAGAPAPDLATAIANVQTAVNSLNNLSALAVLYGPGQMEIPASGSIAYTFTLLVKDAEGHMTDLSASPTITAANAAGTDRSANLSAVTHTPTGQYTFTYTVAAGASQEGLTIKSTGTAASDSTSRVAVANVGVVSVDTTGTLAAIKAKTDLIATNAADSPNEVTAQTTIAANLNTTVSSRLSSAAFTTFLPTNFPSLSIDQATGGVALAPLQPNYAPAKKTDFLFDGSNNVKSTPQTDPAGVTTLLARTDPTAALGAIKTVTDALNTTIESDPTHPGKSRFTVPALANAPAGGGGGGFGGPSTLTLHFTDAVGNPVGNVVFMVGNVGTAGTDGSGSIVIGLNDGQYTINAGPAGGMLFPSTAVTVAGATSVTIVGTAAVIPSPPSANQVVAVMWTRDAHGSLLGNVPITVQLQDAGAVTDQWTQAPLTVTSDNTGLWQTVLERGATYTFTTAQGVPVTVSVPAGAASPWTVTPEILGA